MSMSSGQDQQSMPIGLLPPGYKTQQVPVKVTNMTLSNSSRMASMGASSAQSDSQDIPRGQRKPFTIFMCTLGLNSSGR